MKVTATPTPADQASAPLLRLPVLALPDGAIEALKWLALVFMTGDHVNKYYLYDAYPVLFALGRISLPLFCVVLAYNLARPGALDGGAFRRTCTRLGIFAALATIPYIGLGRLTPGALFFGWWPLNILATLAVATVCIWLAHRGRTRDWLLFAAVLLIGGAAVEFWWPAILLCVGCWWYCRQPGWPALTLWLASTAALGYINHSHWALASFALIFAAQFISLPIPRAKIIFYVYYPAHLAVLWGFAWYRAQQNYFQ
jgi:hypothetical protein